MMLKTENIIAYTSLRISSHQLAIERSRYSKSYIPREQRICVLCKNQAVEDENHFLMECNAYNEDRQKMMCQTQLVCPQFENLNDTNKFFYLMTAEGNISQKVAKFCHVANEQRKIFINSQ
jgi:hypothetical protein